MNALFLAGHPGLDFLNTRFLRIADGAPVEQIGDGQALVEWLLQAGLLDEASAASVNRRFARSPLDQVASSARKLRRWTGEWLALWREAPNGNYRAETRRLNTILEHANTYRALSCEKERFELNEHSRYQAPEELLVLPALQIARLLTEESSSNVKRCAGQGCVLWFLDRTKAHRRLYCSAEACGNRAKVAAFRARQREGLR